ncbi:LysM peptidoglycan-binding domain-containing protein [Alkaliphilus pronyensis]|uniref:LysM peptidoglycan-binding domain-containing protein n=1 Tax=Alkaliphilus pronyensis TaxID=1482732 RepID=A0A6I0FDP9_9FIRM|nr:LysM peptidoglycan-binding domain-containing protein [Alkaliphilus pronyensis]KAB3537367.1 LysM peptidoglycan-binding domain-containing protein [Alkaliphilus pronyensis]
MRTSKREKVLVMALVFVIFLFGYNRLVILGQGAKLDELRSEHAIHQEDIIMLNSIAESELEYDTMLSELAQKSDALTKNYFNTIKQEEIILLINDFVEKSNLSTINMNFTPINKEIIEEIPLDLMEVHIAYEAGFLSLLDFIEEINKHDKKIIIKNLTITSEKDGYLRGDIALSFYGLPNSLNDILTSFNYSSNESTYTFNPFQGFDLENDNDDSNSIAISIGPSRVLLEDFEEDSFIFKGSHMSIKGDGYIIKSSKVGKHSLRLEYDYEKRDENTEAYLILNENKWINEPPVSISMWVYSYNSVDTPLKGRLTDKQGNEYTIDFTQDINWVGWKKVEAMAPQDKSLYPLALTDICLDIQAGESGGGVILLDGLEAVYEEEQLINPIKKDNTHFIHYEVQHNDTLNKISLKFFNNTESIEKIMQLNGLENSKDIQPGKILLIPKQ